MTSNTITNGILKAIGIIIGILILLYFLYSVQSIIIYLAIAAVISLIGSPIIRFLKRKLKFPNTLAVITTMFLFLGILSGLISMFIPLIVQQGENLSLLNIDQLQSNIQNLLNQINDYFLARDIDILNELKHADLFQNVTAIPNLLNSVIGTVGNISIGLFSVIFITFFFMKDTHIMENSIYVMVSDKSQNKLKKSLSTINNLLSRYFIGLVFQITILFIIYTLTLVIFGIENAVVIAFLCSLLNLIPYVGPLIGGFLMLFLSMSSNLGQDFQTEILPTTIYVMIGYVIAQLIDNFLSQPLIFSNSVKSHPLEIFLVIMIGGVLFGVTGMIVAVPTYTAIKVILKAFLSENKIVKSLTKNL
ncbi:MAG: AI-2E family transporter [Lutibacter sp.]|uniref:AI-2E family transporter n=1 Tax=Lutibacter sp. TaxID=1925666 RepID=UPI0017CF07D0|nr:AI-2E family transporter [Lutibacter sp.]MBT8317163.1 AI-2E family transporter [Lutibacter sp.]NNJ58023.1 AI-2E family transporter [Lutibacter sp.]